MCFDLYRILRRRIGFGRILTFLSDLSFSLVSAAIIFYCAHKANYLEFRFYLFGGSLLGLLIYLRFFSPIIKRVYIKVINIITRIFSFIRKIINSFFGIIVYLLTYLMSYPYRLLRWFALLVFRLGQALTYDTMLKIKRIINHIRP